MNILPKKSWHVRNKDNVARVRRDEAKALEEEQECARRRALAEQEARIRILREKAKQSQKEKVETVQWDLPQEPPATEDQSDDEDEEIDPKTEQYVPLNTAFPADQHINLFEDFEKKKKAQGSNKEYEKEKKKMQEDYEKKIGYLTYLGQSASELTKQKPWYEQAPDAKKSTSSVTYSQLETLQASDPLLSMKDYLDEKRRLETTYYNRDGTTANSNTTTDAPVSSHRRKRAAATVESISSAKSEKLSKTMSSDVHKHKKSKKTKKSKKHKKEKRQSPSPEREEIVTKPSMEDLRAARLARETAERQRTLDLVAKYKGVSSPARSVIDERNLTYNSVYSHLPNKHRSHR